MGDGRCGKNKAACGASGSGSKRKKAASGASKQEAAKRARRRALRVKNIKYRSTNAKSVNASCAISRIRDRFVLWRRTNPNTFIWCKPGPGTGDSWRLGCVYCAQGQTSNLVHHKRQQLKRQIKNSAVSCQSICRFGGFSRYEALANNWKAMLFDMKTHAFSDTHKICNAACKAASGAVSLKRASPSGDTAARAKTIASRAETKVVASQDVEAASGAVQTQSIAAFSPRVDIDDCLRSQEGSVFDPFRGRVPSPQDWRDAWADVTSCVSIRKQVKLANMKQRGRISRQARKKMTLIMGEDARQRCRKRLAQATSVTVALDDCGGKKILRFRCDTPGPPYRYDGLIGVVCRIYIQSKKSETITRNIA